jgi:hypothetical protein
MKPIFRGSALLDADSSQTGARNPKKCRIDAFSVSGGDADKPVRILRTGFYAERFRSIDDVRGFEGVSARGVEGEEKKGRGFYTRPFSERRVAIG